MAAQDRATLKAYFATGNKPTSAQFGDVIDSFALVSAAGSAGAFGAVFIQTGTTAAAQDLIATSAAKGILEATTTAALVSALGGTTTGQALIQATNATAAVETGLSATTIGKGLFYAATTAAAGELVLDTQAGVSAGTYVAPEITIDTKGRITAVSAGTAPTVVQSVSVTIAATLATNLKDSIVHGLGGVPSFVQVYYQCVSAVNGFAIGDRIAAGHGPIDAGTANQNVQVYYNATSAAVRTGSVFAPTILPKASGAQANMDLDTFHLKAIFYRFT